jgi:hypothetical protein
MEIKVFGLEKHHWIQYTKKTQVGKILPLDKHGHQLHQSTLKPNHHNKYIDDVLLSIAQCIPHTRKYRIVVQTYAQQLVDG